MFVLNFHGTPGSNTIGQLYNDLVNYAAADNIVQISTLYAQDTYGYQGKTLSSEGFVAGQTLAQEGYDMILGFKPAALGSPTYFTFDFSKYLDPQNVTYGGNLTLDQFALVPEPSSLALIALGVMGLGTRRRRRSSRRSRAGPAPMMPFEVDAELGIRPP